MKSKTLVFKMKKELKNIIIKLYIIIKKPEKLLTSSLFLKKDFFVK